MKNYNRKLGLTLSIFLIISTILSVLVIPLPIAKAYPASTLDYIYTKGWSTPWNVVYDTVHAPPGTTVTVDTSESDWATAQSTQRKVIRLSDGTLYVIYPKKLAGLYQIFVKKSINDGRTWKDAIHVSTDKTAVYHQDDPSIAVDSNDNLHAVWHGLGVGSTYETQIWYSKYTGSWSAPIRISIKSGMNARQHLYPSIAVGPSNNLHVAWVGRNTTAGGLQVWYTTYTDSWSDPLTISTYAGMAATLQYNPSVALDTNGHIHVVWHGKATGFTLGNQIWHTEYTDSWSYPVHISTYSGMAGVSQKFPSIAVGSDNHLHVVWEGKATGFLTDIQIWYALHDGSWNPPVRISTYTDMNNWEQSNPTIAVDPEDDIHVLWSEKGAGPSYPDRIWYATYTVSWATPIMIQPVGEGEFPSLKWSMYNDWNVSGPGWEGSVTITDLNVTGFNFTEGDTVDVFDWGSSWGDSAFWYTDNAWVFEGKRRYHFQIDYENETLSTVEQFGLRFTDETDQIHTIWYDQDANTLTVTSPYDGISGWVRYFNQDGTDLTVVIAIMFNKPIPDSYDVQLEIRIVADTDSGWLTPSGGVFNIYNLGGLSTLYESGTAGRIPGGDIFEIYAADTRTRNIIPTQDFDVRVSSLAPGVQILGIQIIEAEDEQKLLDELSGWKTWMTSRTETRTIYPTNRLPSTGVSGDRTYNSYPFGLLIKSDSVLNESLIIEKQFFRKIDESDDEIVTVEVWATVANDTKITGQILISDDGYVDDLIKGVNTDTLRIVDFKFYGNGSIRLNNGTSNIYPATYTGMEWANYTFVMNLTAQNYDFYVDEVLNATSVEFRENATSVGHISFLDTLNPVFPAQPVEFYVDDVWVHTDFNETYGGVAEATMLFDMNQHWSMDFDFFVEQGQVYAQGASGTPRRTNDDYSNYGYVELGWDVMIDNTLVHDFLVARVNITDGYISGKNNWIQFNVSWYEQGVYVKNDLLYGLFEGYSIWPGGEKDTAGFHWDIWFNRANASTVVGARINTEYFGLSDKSVWWAIWSSKWTPMRSEVSESTIFIDLEDVNGTINSANDVSFVRSWVKVLRDTRGQFAYKVLNIAGLDFLIAIDTMSGIDTPPIRETLVPEVLSGFFGSALGGIFSAALKRLGNTLAGFGMGFFTMSIDFIDNVFAALGYPALVSTIFGWMDSLFASVPTLVGYGMTLIGNIFNLINTSASNTLTQLTAVITIWIGMYSTTMDFLTGVLTPGFNLWNDLGVSSFIQVGAIMYPLWLLILASEKGMQAVIDHLTGVLNIGSFFLNFILNVAGFFMGLLTGLIGAIRG